jgi:hypothetical protein
VAKAPKEAVVEDVVGEAAPEGYVKNRLDGGYLPPIHRLKMPKTKTQTATIRWLYALGYEVKEISNGLNVRYQQVRNMVMTIPKRAAREDLPPLVVELGEMEDIVETLLGVELERTFEEARKSKRREGFQAQRKAREDAKGNEDLDDENYGRE